MNYTYVGSGTIRVSGCSSYGMDYFLYYAFAVGSFVYSRKKAATRGVYERICIKDVIYPAKMLEGMRRTLKFQWVSPLYLDTLNGLWNENELVSYADATTLIQQYRASLAIREPERDGVKVSGSAAYRLTYFLYYDFAIGSIVYSKKKALKGIYERVCIKDVRFPDSTLQGMRETAQPEKTYPVYVDTLNGIWNEDELVGYGDATFLIEQALLRDQALAEDLTFHC